jgi:metal-dependent HD superfamily phosphatase/phosphodiesterase
LIEERASGVEPSVLAEMLHAVASHHDGRSARTPEAAVLYHANQLDSAAAARQPLSEEA